MNTWQRGSNCPAFWDAWFSVEQGSWLYAVTSGAASKTTPSASRHHLTCGRLCASGSTPYPLDARDTRFPGRCRLHWERRRASSPAPPLSSFAVPGLLPPAPAQAPAQIPGRRIVETPAVGGCSCEIDTSNPTQKKA